ncbi:PAS domain-containing protein [Adhaeribacter terreus]|uniref:histidine kinase n=1 Tax=Adhaeribacter terreus TaxID=529703 RepID=A0ABW0EC33_9BACT
MDFFNLFANIPGTMVVVSPELKILAATDAYLKLTMRKREDIIGKHFLLEAFPDSQVSYEDNPVRKSLEKALQTKQTDYMDVIRYGITRSEEDGGGVYEGYWEASHTPVLDANGNVEYLIQHTSDVTEREKTKIALSVTENKFRFMAETLPQLVFTLSPEGNITYLNQRWATYSGVNTEDLMHNKRWNEIYDAKELESIVKKWSENFNKGQDIQLEVRKRSKDGQYRWFLCKSQPMRDEQGNIIMWAGSCTDIHDMRQMVQELLQSNEQMSALSDQVQIAYKQAETERKTLENLIMKAPAFFCLLDGPDHRYKLVNDKYQQLFPNRQLEGRTVAEAVPEVVEQGFIDILDNVYNTGKEFIAEEIPVKLDLHDTGKIDDVYLNFIYQALYDDTDKITGILVFGYVVDEQVKYRQKLQELGKA